MVSFFLSIFFLFLIDHCLKSLLSSYIDSEVERVTSIVVHKALETVNKDRDDYFTIVKEEGNTSKIRYNTKKINQFNDMLVKEIEQEYREIEFGNYDSYHYAMQEKLRKKYPFFKNGYLCEVSFNSLRGSTMFGNVGPVIPIKLSFMGYVNSTVEIRTHEYGVNNTIVEVDSIVTVSNLVTMPISSKMHQTIVKNVLSLEIITGEVPQYYSGALR